jgi:CubicO group peptidase (beta-lactamase class C family)
MNDSDRPPKPRQPLSPLLPGMSASRDGPDPRAARPSWQIGVFLMMGCLLVVLALWPWSIQSPSVIWAPATHDPLGTVQTEGFVGGWATGTRIDTETRTVVVRGVTRFQPGMAVEMRSSFFYDYVCEVGSDSCYGLMPWSPALSAVPAASALACSGS